MGTSGTDRIQRAFLIDSRGLHDLGTLPNGTEAVAKAINLKRQIVGSAGTTPPRTGQKTHGFLWSDGQLRDLNSLIPDAQNWSLESADGINDAGQIIGSGFHFDGKQWVTTSFLMTPP